MTDWQIAVVVVSVLAVFAAGWLIGEHRQRLAELRHRNELRRLLEEIHRERGAITLDAVGWVWVAVALWGCGLLAVWWFGS